MYAVWLFLIMRPEYRVNSVAEGFCLFLNKYDLKHDQYFTQVLKLNKGNPNK